MEESKFRMAMKDLLQKKTPPRLARLHTPWEAQPEIPWEEYPRPQLRRESFFCLNGCWSFQVNGEDRGTILVPYPPEAKLSGAAPVRPGDRLIYEREFSLPEGFRRDRVLLHFGAVDQICTVKLNGQELGSHTGGYLPFSFDVTDHLQETNRLQVCCLDELNHDFPYGKQRSDRGGMWYTPVSGIWQTVWMESVPERAIRSLKISADLDRAVFQVEGDGPFTVRCDGKIYRPQTNCFSIRPQEPKLWSPEHPHLYHVTIENGSDRVHSYFALRTIASKLVAGVPRLCLNGAPYFFHGLLDQGYYPDGIFLPGSPEGYTFDIQTMKSLGFNTLRKHIKVEPERFYYDCDRLGMVVFQDMVNSGDYYYLRDTAIPTLGGKGFTYHPRPSTIRRAAFERHCRETMLHLHNHPCILLYTLFNEGWGQYDTRRIFRTLKPHTAGRIFNAVSGWFHCSDSDVQAEHVYFGDLTLKGDGKRPLLLTEFGGYSWPIEGHRFNLDEEYGYQKFTNQSDFQRAISELYREKILPQVAAGLCGAILTQVSDVEDETNGLVTYDRQVVKADREEMCAIAAQLRAAL